VTKAATAQASGRAPGQHRLTTVPVPGRAPGQAAARGEAVLVYTAVLYRAYGLSQVLFTAMLGWEQHPDQPQLAWLSGVIVAESAAVMLACQRRRRVLPWVMAADTAFSVAVLLAAARLVDVPGLPDFAYTYTVVSSVAVGFAFRRYRTVLALTVALAAAYYGGESVFRHATFDTLAPDSISYFTNTGVTWVVARYLRRINARLDASQAAALAQAEALSAERERARHASILHDRVLQTLETLARGNWLSDEAIRRHVAQEAAWLRALVNGRGGPPGDLLAGLSQLVQDHALTGLHVDFSAALLYRSAHWQAGLSGRARAALVDAAREALTNVTKHAGVAEATMRAHCTPYVLTVSVLDHGAGFDPAWTPPGLGLRESITRRLADAGGAATVQSAPGEGTYVELTVPLNGTGPGEARTRSDETG